MLPTFGQIFLCMYYVCIRRCSGYTVPVAVGLYAECFFSTHIMSVTRLRTAEPQFTLFILFSVCQITLLLYYPWDNRKLSLLLKIMYKISAFVIIAEYHCMRKHWGMEMKQYSFITLVLYKAYWLASRSCQLIFQERALDTHWTGDYLLQKQKFPILAGNRILSSSL